mgnify:CR=1 FL=1
MLKRFALCPQAEVDSLVSKMGASLAEVADPKEADKYIDQVKPLFASAQQEYKNGKLVQARCELDCLFVGVSLLKESLIFSLAALHSRTRTRRLLRCARALATSRM